MTSILVIFQVKPDNSPLPTLTKSPGQVDQLRQLAVTLYLKRINGFKNKICFHFLFTVLFNEIVYTIEFKNNWKTNR